MWGLRGWLALLGVAAIIAAGVWFLLRDDRLLPIAADVPYASIDGNLVFGARVNQNFPIGMKIAELRAELKRDGFAFDQAIAPDRDGSARLVRENLLCRKVWYVAWQANADGRLRGVTGSFGRHCIWN